MKDGDLIKRNIIREESSAQEWYKVQKNELWGLYKIEYKNLQKPTNQSNHRNFLSSIDLSQLNGNKDISLTELIPPLFNDICPIKNKRDILGFKVCLQDKYGIFDQNGNKIIDSIYPQVVLIEESFSYYWGIVNSNNKLGILSFEGNEIIPSEYEDIDIKCNLIIAKKNNRFQIFHMDGSKFLPESYESIKIDYCLKTYIEVCNNEVFSRYDIEGNVIIPYYDNIVQLSDDELDHSTRKNFWLKTYSHNKTGLFSIVRNSLILEPIYEKIKVYDCGVVVYFDNNNRIVTGLIDYVGNIKIPLEYEYINRLEGEYFIVGVNKKEGLININNGKILPAIYDKIENIASFNEFFFIKDNDKIGIVDKDYNLILPVIYDRIETIYSNYHLSSNYFNLYKEGCWGLYSYLEKRIVIPTEYDFIEKLTDDFYIVKQNRNYGLYSINGESLLDCNYNSIRLDSIFNNDTLYIRLYKDGLLGICRINKSNNKNYCSIIISCNYHAINRNEVFIVSKNGLYGAYNLNGTKIIEEEFSSISVEETFIKVTKEENIGIYSFDGKEILKPVYTCVEKNKFGHYKVWKNNLCGIFSQEGKPIIPIHYDEISIYNDDLYQALDNNLKGFYKQNGELILPAIIQDFKEEKKYILYKGDIIHNIIRIKVNNLWGLFSFDTNQTIVETIYESIEFINNIIVAKKDNKLELLSISGDYSYSIPLDSIEYLTNTHEKDLLIIKQNNKKGLINCSNEKIIVPIRFDDINRFGNEWYLVKNDGLLGLYTNHGIEICPTIYDEIIREGKYEYKNLYMVRKNKYWGILNLYPPIFNKIDYHFNYIVLEINDYNEFNNVNWDVLKEKYKYIYHIFLFVKQEQKWTIFNKDGNIKKNLIFTKFQYTRNFISFQIEGKWELFDQDINPITNLSFLDIEDIDKNYNNKNVIAMDINFKYGCINSKGEIIIPFIYDYLLRGTDNTPFFGRLENKKYGIDNLGRLISINDFVAYDDSKGYDNGIIQEDIDSKQIGKIFYC